MQEYLNNGKITILRSFEKYNEEFFDENSTNSQIYYYSRNDVGLLVRQIFILLKLFNF